jgi:hypothetical protein
MTLAPAGHMKYEDLSCVYPRTMVGLARMFKLRTMLGIVLKVTVFNG